MITAGTESRDPGWLSSLCGDRVYLVANLMKKSETVDCGFFMVCHRNGLTFISVADQVICSGISAHWKLFVYLFWWTESGPLKMVAAEFELCEMSFFFFFFFFVRSPKQFARRKTTLRWKLYQHGITVEARKLSSGNWLSFDGVCPCKKNNKILKENRYMCVHLTCSLGGRTWSNRSGKLPSGHLQGAKLRFVR